VIALNAIWLLFDTTQILGSGFYFFILFFSGLLLKKINVAQVKKNHPKKKIKKKIPYMKNKRLKSRKDSSNIFIATYWNLDLLLK
jgi:hypothetical protein